MKFGPTFVKCRHSDEMSSDVLNVTLPTCLNYRISDAVQKCQKTDVLQKCHKTDAFQKRHNIDARKNCRNSDEMWSEILNVALPTSLCCHSSDVSRTVAISTDVTRPTKMEIIQNVRRATLTRRRYTDSGFNLKRKMKL